ncbi:hypothetical protein QTN25_003260 [Entamoeba marina]
MSTSSDKSNDVVLSGSPSLFLAERLSNILKYQERFINSHRNNTLFNEILGSIVERYLSLQTEVVNLQNKLSAPSNTFLFEQLKQYEEKNGQLQMQLEEKNDQLQMLLEEEKKEKGRLENNNNKLKEDNNRLKEDNNQLKEDNNQLKEDNNQLEEDNNQLEEEKNQLKEEKNRLEDDNNQLKEDNNQLKEDKNQLEEEKNQLQKQLKKEKEMRDEALPNLILLMTQQSNQAKKFLEKFPIDREERIETSQMQCIDVTTQTFFDGALIMITNTQEETPIVVCVHDSSNKENTQYMRSGILGRQIIFYLEGNKEYDVCCYKDSFKNVFYKKMSI